MPIRRLIPAIALLALTTACGTDKSTNPAPADPATLTAAEFNGMVEALTTADAFGFGTSVAASGLLQSTLPAQNTQTIPISQTVACPIRGSAFVNGTVTKNFASPSSGNITMYVQVTFNDCVASSSDGLQFTFDGNPTLNESVTGTFAHDSTSLSAHETGDVRWSSANGKSGTCPFSLGVTTAVTGLIIESHATGQVCGSSIDKTF